MNPSQRERKFRFSSKYIDEEIGDRGLYYYGYRFYSPNLGRWSNRDPIGEKSIRNIYNYCNNNSLNTYDVLGLDCKSDLRNKLISIVNNNTEWKDKFFAAKAKCDLKIRCSCDETICPKGGLGKRKCGQMKDMNPPPPGGKKSFEITYCQNNKCDIGETLVHEIQHFMDQCNGTSPCVGSPNDMAKCECFNYLCDEMRAFKADGTCTDKPSCANELIKLGYFYRNPDCTAIIGMPELNFIMYVLMPKCNLDDVTVPVIP